MWRGMLWLAALIVAVSAPGALANGLRVFSVISSSTTSAVASLPDCQLSGIHGKLNTASAADASDTAIVST